MNLFPEEWELLSLFECEPTISERDVPWFYNRLTFETKRGSDEIHCEIEPAYETVNITWWHGGKEKVKLELHWVGGLQVVTGGGIDYLIVKFRDRYSLALEFHLKPEIRLRWANSTEYPPSTF